MSGKPRRVATVDLGSNSFLLLVADIHADQRIDILRDEICMPRLGEGLTHSGMISQHALERAGRDLQHYQTMIADLKVDEVYAVTTAAVRSASNQTDVLTRLSQALGHPIEMISGEHEAALTYTSVAFEEKEKQASMAAIDIGGGSTEIALGKGPHYLGGHSFAIGTVKLLELFFKDAKSHSNIRRAKDYIIETFASHPMQSLPSKVFGTAGSFTHLASLALKLHSYDAQIVQGFGVTRALIQEWITTSQQLSSAELAQLKGADPQRVDLLLPGCLIIECLLSHFKLDTIEVKDRGIRYGLLYELLTRDDLT